MGFLEANYQFFRGRHWAGVKVVFPRLAKCYNCVAMIRLILFGSVLLSRWLRLAKRRIKTRNSAKNVMR